MNAVDPRSQTWRVLLSLPGRVGMVAPVTADDLERRASAAASASGGRGADAMNPAGGAS